jgi:glycosyltransferase involved in cell wall biosynthesis
MPLVSIVVPAYNVENYIETCLRSLLSQTLHDIEVVCVDDASTDGTGRIVQELAKSDSRLYYVRNERNLNLFATRHVGAARTTGTYVTFLDADDEFVPETCEKLVEQMSRDEVDVLHFGVHVVAEPWCDKKTVDGIEKTMNPVERRLEGKDILKTCFLDWAYDYNLNHKLYNGELIRRVLGGLGLTPGISAAEDVVEYFAVALEAKSYRAISPSEYYVYHVGRGQTGSEGVSPAGFARSSTLKRRCCDVLSDYLSKTGALSDTVVSHCLSSVFRHELEHTMNVWQDEVPLNVRSETLRTALDLWDERDVARELYRFLRDDAHALSQMNLSSSSAKVTLDRFETNKACLEGLLPEAQLWNSGEDSFLAMRESARTYYEELLDAMARNHDSSDDDAAWIMAERDGRCSRLDRVLAGKRPDETFAALFRRIFVDGRFEAISTLQGAESLHVTRSEVKTVGLYYFRLAGGGAEEVTCSLASMFLREGYRVVLLCDILPPVGSIPPGAALVRLPDLGTTNPDNYLRRGHVLEEAMRRHKVDLFICSQWQSHCLEWDQFVIKALGIAFVVHTHGSCTHIIAHDSEDDYALPIAYRLSDAVVCLDDVDRAFWSLFNKRTYTTVNRSSFSTLDITAAPLVSHKIIWVGRMSWDEKRPVDAIEILSRVIPAVPDARLEMVGPGEPEVLERLRSRARELDVEDSVTFLGSRDDVSSLMSGASVHLLTSPSESFSLVVLESKTCGVPCVMYRLPIRFSREGKGLVNVRQGDLDGAADAIVKILTDKSLRHHLGLEARASAKDIESFDVHHLWETVFATALSPYHHKESEGGSEVAASQEMQVSMCATAYADVLKRNRERSDQENRMRELQERVSELEAELSSLRSSRTFRAGEAVAAPIHVLRRIVGESGK